MEQNIIYPENVKKYVGTIFETKNNTFTVSIKSHNTKLNKTFKSYNEGKIFLKNINIQLIEFLPLIKYQM